MGSWDTKIKEKDQVSSVWSLLFSLNLTACELGTLIIPISLCCENQTWLWIEKHFAVYSSCQFHLGQSPGPVPEPSWQFTAGLVHVVSWPPPATFTQSFTEMVLGSVTSSFHGQGRLTPDPPFHATNLSRPLQCCLQSFLPVKQESNSQTQLLVSRLSSISDRQRYLLCSQWRG